MSNQLNLWSFGTPNKTIAQFLGVNERKNDKGELTALSVSLIKKNTLRKMLGLDGKHNKTAWERKSLELGDQLKEVMGREVVGIVSSPEFVGARMTTGKNGVTLRFARVNRPAAPKLTPEQLVGAMVEQGMTDDQILEAISKARASKEAPIEVSTTVTEVKPEAEKTAEVATA